MSRAVFTRNYSTKRDDRTRQRMLAKIHLEFPKLRPDLRHSTEDMRLERLAFCEQVLSLRKPLDSMRRLTEKQLSRVIEAIKEKKPQTALPGCGVHHFKREDEQAKVQMASQAGCGVEEMKGAIIHLAGTEQVWAINKLAKYLSWSPKGMEGFLQSKYKRNSAGMLSPRQANSCLMILFNIAASRDLKAEHGQQVRITRSMIGRYIPQLKRKLGIDQGVSQ